MQSHNRPQTKANKSRKLGFDLSNRFCNKLEMSREVWFHGQYHVSHSDDPVNLVTDRTPLSRTQSLFTYKIKSLILRNSLCETCVQRKAITDGKKQAR